MRTGDRRLAPFEHHLPAARCLRAGEAEAAHALTPQEFPVARTLGQGLSRVEAAASRFLSHQTIEARLTGIQSKLGVRSRADLARRPARGLVG
ncbi:response regulator transcription factor [Streptomyces sp. NPDC058964]|uniref:response regulator transcription factor n=1 Tax=Streptomyces sp. NPDC058964 TaxID=3346681 RepID=UPI0036CAFBFB